MQISSILLFFFSYFIFGAVEEDGKCSFSGFFAGQGAPLVRGPWASMGGWQWGVCQPMLEPCPLFVPSRDACTS